MQNLEVGAVLGNILQGVQQDIGPLPILVQHPVAVEDVLQRVDANGETQAGDPVCVDLRGGHTSALAKSDTLGRFPRHVASAGGAREPGKGEEDGGFVEDGCRFVVELFVEDEDVALALVGCA